MKNDQKRYNSSTAVESAIKAAARLISRMLDDLYSLDVNVRNQWNPQQLLWEAQR